MSNNSLYCIVSWWKHTAPINKIFSILLNIKAIFQITFNQVEVLVNDILGHVQDFES